MVAKRVPSDLPFIVTRGSEQQPQSYPIYQDQAGYWSTTGLDNVARATFDRGYHDTYQQVNQQRSLNMQRFRLEDGPWSPTLDQKPLHFMTRNQAPMTPSLYGPPNPWPSNVHMPSGICQQEDSWSSGWTSTDQDSNSAATGNTWTPPPPESCLEQDPRNIPWADSQGYTVGYSYPGYSSGLGHGRAMMSPHSDTGTLSEIQQFPDMETESDSLKEDIRMPDRDHPGVISRLDTGSALFHRDEGLGSSVQGSAMDSSAREDESIAVESVNADSDNGSDYSPPGRSKRGPQSRKPQSNPRPRASTSPTAKRLSMSKGKTHQLTTPARIAKRTSLPSRSSIPVLTSTSSHDSHNNNNNGNNTNTSSKSICDQCHAAFPSASTLSKHVLSAHTRPFTCSFRIYGCNSTFGSKNEWKRHVSSIHLCLGRYRCDFGHPDTPTTTIPSPSNPSTSRSRSSNNNNSSSTTPNTDNNSNHQGCDYRSNRKDLFTQHLHRMHRPAASAPRAQRETFELSLDDIRKRCWKHERDPPPRSTCGFCSAAANGTATNQSLVTHFSSWDDRMEHVGRHLEKGDPGPEDEDLELRDWMVREGLLTVVKGGFRIDGAGGKRRGRGSGSGSSAAGTVGWVNGRSDGVAMEDGEEDADGEDE
ncbi:MAG: hypothetical protein Q9220_003307 [cf. Caloplaca sp. 1 TL-2023]